MTHFMMNGYKVWLRLDRTLLLFCWKMFNNIEISNWKIRHMSEDFLAEQTLLIFWLTKFESFMAARVVKSIESVHKTWYGNLRQAHLLTVRVQP